MKESRVREIFAQTKAIITQSHLVYASGKHGSEYVNKDAVYPDTEATDELCKGIAARFVLDKVEVVVAPAVGGVILSQGVARHLTKMTGRKVFGIYADKVEGSDALVVKRGYDKYVLGKRILVVDDVLTTGGSVKKLVKLVGTLGGIMVGVGVLCNRGNVQPADVEGVPKLEALISVQMAMYEEAACPLCAQGVPINTEVGEGAKYLLSRKAKAV